MEIPPLGLHQRGVLLSSMSDTTGARLMGWSLERFREVRQQLRAAQSAPVANLPAVVSRPVDAPIPVIEAFVDVGGRAQRGPEPLRLAMPSKSLPMADQIEELEALVEDLRLRLEDQQGKPDAVVAWHLMPFHLTTKEAMVLGRLWRSCPAVVSKEQLHLSIYADDIDGGAEIKIIDVFVCKIRRKISGFGLKIETAWGRGYWMPRETQAELLALAERKVRLRLA